MFIALELVLESYAKAIAIGCAAIIALSPSILGILAANNTARDLRGEASDLLRLSNVSSEELMWSYVLAMLYRQRGLLRVVVSLMPVLAVMVGFGLLFAGGINYDPANCVASPLGIKYCRVESIGSATVLVMGLLQLAVAGFGVALSLLGMSVLTTLIGVGSAFLWKGQSAALACTVAFSLLIGSLTVFVTIPELTYCALLVVYPLHIIVLIAYATLFAVVPYILLVFVTQLLRQQVFRAV